MAKRKKDKGRNDDPQNIAWKHKYHSDLAAITALQPGVNSGAPEG
jgi:hypothetical protein